MQKWTAGVLAVLLSFVIQGLATTYYVSPAADGGDDDNDGLTRSTPWLHIARGQPARINGTATPAGDTEITTMDGSMGFAPTGQIRIVDEVINYSSINQAATTFTFQNLHNEGTGGNTITGTYANGTFIYDNLILGGDSFDPGDVINVTTGNYPDETDIRIGGSPGNPLTYQADGQVSVSDYTGPFEVYGASGSPVTDVTIDGFIMYGGYENMILSYAQDIVVKNCVFEFSRSSAEEHVLALTDVVAAFTNCVFGPSPGVAIDMNNAQEVNVKNCVFFGSMRYALYIRNSVDTVMVANCDIIANRLGGIYVYDGSQYQTYTSDAEIGTDRTLASVGRLYTITNCMARNPGFANGMGESDGRRRFDALYDNSPLLNAGEGGQNIGVSQNPTLVAVPASPQTYYVSTGGNDSDGSSWDNAWHTISQAAAAAVAGDTVLVGAGTYSESVTITNGGSHNLPVTYRAEGTVLVNGVANPITLSGVAEVTLDGFQVDGSTRGVYLDYGFSNTVANMEVDGGTIGGIYIYNSTMNTIQDCNIYGSAIGLHLDDMYLAGGNVARRCNIYDNTLGVEYRSDWNLLEACNVYNNTGSGVFIGNNLMWTMFSCNIYSNGTHGIDQGEHGRNGRAYNCTIYGNGEDGLRNYNYNVYLNNSIIAGNGTYGINEPQTGDGIYAKNCLFWNNGSSGTDHFRDQDGTVYSTVAGIESATPAGSCEDIYLADPQFVSIAQNDYRLRPNSPAIDTGDASINDTDYVADQSTDILGNPRIKNTALDIGAHEWQPWAGTVIMIK